MKSSLLTATGLPRAAAVLAAAGLLLTGCAADPTLDENWPEIRQKVMDAQSLRLQMDGGAAPDAFAGHAHSGWSPATARRVCCRGRLRLRPAHAGAARPRR